MESRTINNCAFHLLESLDRLKESNPKLKLLDVGGGPGSITIGFAQRLPDGHITTVDLDPQALAKAKINAYEAGVSNIEFHTADVHELPFADDTFDITHCHQVLTHVRNPADALREMLRVTKPHGVVAAREGDHETECFWPRVPGLVYFHDFVSKMMKASGGTPNAGRQLLSWAIQAGVDRRKITHKYGTSYYSATDEKRVWADGMIEAIHTSQWRVAGIQAGLVTEKELDEMVDGWNEWAQDDTASLGTLQGEIIIKK
ncbi:hypothetical protein O1611_g6116 [Lasiodiplodia mahajangana]|uniref:Uncharacterized protein n=1 Tax=Lasiodiplodia mahajangana TaxID=1108764 RepID=A0ACC2JJ51_9PEZI|nr:hypothetical protein O1611_g6116 [Lasiodiplodia mahajangana]